MGSFYSHFFWLLLSVPLHCIASNVNGYESQSFHAISIASLLPSARCSSTSTAQAESNNKRLKVVHRHGPCSPVGRWKDHNPGQILRQDRSRVHALHQRINGAASKPETLLATTTVPANAGVGEYIITVGFGTPKLEFSVIFDTGSDLSWIQCQPCVQNCYPQKDRLFDPSQSSTYSNISCYSDDCSSASELHGCDSSNCLYEVHYGDGSISKGFFARDTLTLTPFDVVKDFRFGCGEGYSGDFGGAAGLIGLGRGNVSLVSQVAKKYGGYFSYCLPTRSSSSGHLTIGAGVQHSDIKFTRMLTVSYMPSFYFVELIGMSVGGKDLSIPSTVLTNVGTIIDSGTTVTWLPPAAYLALRSEFRQHMSEYSLVAPFEILDTCYNFTGYNSITVPAVALQFSAGVTLNVDASGILFFVSPSQGCLAFASNGHEDWFSIFGNMQQRTFDVVYDVSRERIGFGAGGCS